MVGGKTSILVVSGDEMYGNALRRALNGGYHTEVDTVLPSSDPDVDLIVWHLVDSGAAGEVMLERFHCPTLVIGPAQPDPLIRAVEARAAGFVSDDASLDEIVKAVGVVLDGGAVIPPGLLGALLRHLVDKKRTLEPSLLDQLTARELEIFELAANGVRIEDVAESLFISPNTARTHLQNVYRKLEIHSRSELVALAARTGHLRTGDT